jgi:phosphoribosylanthranilate isomerase
MVRVKICGITNWTDAKLAIDEGADALGFNFCTESPRRITTSSAKDIIRRMPRRVAAVGVFVNAREHEILRIARAADLAALQLHGEESSAMVERLAREFPVIKAFRVRPRFRLGSLARYKAASAFLLDGFDPKLRGGTGKKFDWRVAITARKYGPVILAGGLRAENITDAIRRARPFAVDICSGVETRPGKKDAKKVKALMMAVKQLRREER